MMKADIHSFESLAAIDGEGLRYAVFFTGCPLRCACCHNPDTWHKSGKEMTSEELYKKIRRYKPYFKNGGGVTFSGGEPLLNADFINETAALLKQEDINYALDTSGAVSLTDSVKAAVNGAELILLDIKYPNAELYEKYARGNFEKFCAFADYVSKQGKRVWYRTVIIPQINDSMEAVDEYLRLISRWKKPERYELLAFHTMGFFKYDELGMENPLKGVPPMDKDRLRELQAYLEERIK